MIVIFDKAKVLKRKVLFDISDKLSMQNQSEDLKKRFYFKEVESSKVSEVLVQAVLEDARVYVWQKGQPKEQMEAYSIFSTQGTLLKLKSEGFFMKLKKSKNVDQNVLFKFIVKKNHYFSSSLFTFDKKSDLFLIDVVNALYQSVQRKSYRLEADESIKVQVKIDSKMYDCIDISAGGASFTIDSTQVGLFGRERVFTNCSLFFNETVYGLSKIKVTSVEKAQEQGERSIPKFQIGLAFLELDYNVEGDLTKQINAIVCHRQMMDLSSPPSSPKKAA